MKYSDVIKPANSFLYCLCWIHVCDNSPLWLLAPLSPNVYPDHKKLSLISYQYIWTTQHSHTTHCFLVARMCIVFVNQRPTLWHGKLACFIRIKNIFWSEFFEAKMATLISVAQHLQNQHLPFHRELSFFLFAIFNFHSRESELYCYILYGTSALV